jgi:hypothetical protein
MICTPIGKPVRERSIGAEVAGSPHILAGSAHTKHASRKGYALPSISRCRASWDCRKIRGHAAIAIAGWRSLAGGNLCPKPEPSVPL